MRTLLLLLLVTIIFVSCKKKASPEEVRSLTGDWNIYTEDATKIGTLSFRTNDSVYFHSCCSQNGVYAAAGTNRYRVTFAVRAWACPATCFNWFAADKGIVIKQDRDELLFYSEQQTIVLRGRRPAPR